MVKKVDVKRTNPRTHITFVIAAIKYDKKKRFVNRENTAPQNTNSHDMVNTLSFSEGNESRPHYSFCQNHPE